MQDLAEHCSFEEVAYLIWNGELPTKAQLREFEKAERSHRPLTPTLLEVMRKFPRATRIRWTSCEAA